MDMLFWYHSYILILWICSLYIQPAYVAYTQDIIIFENPQSNDTKRSKGLSETVGYLQYSFTLIIITIMGIVIDLPISFYYNILW